MKAQFRKKGWIYLPIALAGWIITIIYCSVSVYTLYAINRHYSSLYSSLIRFFPYFISFSVLLFWIAFNTSKDTKEKM
jgi:hypothetical protein